MLSSPGRTGERAANLARQLGLTAGETTPSYGWGKPAVVGAVDGTTTALKAYGGKWSARDKALVFGSWAELEGILTAILRDRNKPSGS